MKTIAGWKKNMLASCMAGLMVFGGVMGTGAVSVWALPSSGTSVGGNIVVRDAANGNQIGSLTQGQKVNITDQAAGTDGHDWYAITFDVNGTQTKGWVRSDLINTSGTGAEEPEGEAPQAGGENTAPAEGDGPDTEEPASVFQIGENSYTIAEKLPKQLPQDFTATEITYMGAEVPAVKHNNAELFLLYLEDVSNDGDDGFYVYDSERDTVLPFVTVSMGGSYVIPIDVPTAEEGVISSRYIRNDCGFEAGSVMAYQQQQPDSTTAADIAVSDFYYLYGVSGSGQSGWYLYDAGNGSIQRSTVSMQYAEQVQESAPEEAEPEEAPIAFDMGSTIRMLVSVLALLCLLFLVLAIIFSVRYRRLRRYLNEEDESYGEEPENETARGRESVRKEIREPVRESEDPASGKLYEVEIPGKSGTVDLLDLDDEETALEPSEILAAEDGVQEASEGETERSEEDEPEFYDDEDEPEFYDDEDELEFYDDEESEEEDEEKPSSDQQ